MNILLLGIQVLLLNFFYRKDKYFVCGAENSNSSSIGRPAVQGQFPFVVRMYMKGMTSFATCTGSIVKEGLILTGGRCCEVETYNTEVVLGKINHMKYTQSFGRDGYYIYKVRNKFIHPDLHRMYKRTKHDLCFLTLEDSMRGDGHKIIRSDLDKLPNDKSCIVIGWGSAGGNLTRHMLSYRRVRAYNCGQFYCLRDRSSCPGDSGKPLICNGKLVGLSTSSIAYGESETACARSVPDIYSRLYDNKIFFKRLMCGMYPVADENVVHLSGSFAASASPSPVLLVLVHLLLLYKIFAIM